MKIDGVVRIFYGFNHIAVGKQNTSNWDSLTPEIYKAIYDHYLTK